MSQIESAATGDLPDDDEQEPQSELPGGGVYTFDRKCESAM
jgi:hypothetical protein